MSSAAEDVLEQLDWRTHRVEHIIQGTEITNVNATAGTRQDEVDVQRRLQNIEGKLANLTKSSPLVTDLLRLCMFTTLPLMLYYSLNLPIVEEVPFGAHGARDEGNESIDKATIVLASSTTFQAAQSRLSSLEGMKLDDPSALVPLVTMQHHLALARTKQDDQQTELAELRARTAQVLAQWYRGSVLKGGEQLAGYEQRLLDVERTVRRRELAQQQDMF